MKRTLSYRMKAMTNNHDLIDFFNAKAAQYNHPSFIKDDPILIPHQFSTKQDIEIAGLFAALFAWGTRTSIINSCKRLMNFMGNKPYEFIMNMEDDNPEAFLPMMKFVHRTFNSTDLFYLLDFLKYHYQTLGEGSLETAFTKGLHLTDTDTENALNGFHNYVFSGDIHKEYPQRTKKHIAAPFKKSACKRLNMYLRWMVRSDNNGVDFGIWKTIKPSQLVCPIDVHVARVAKRFNLLDRKQNDWLSAIELTNYLKKMDANDPVKYDYALFGLGVIEKF